MKGFSCYLIGENSLLIQCAEILLNRGHLVFGVISSAPEIKQWAYNQKIPSFEMESFLANNLETLRIDYLFSIANGYILKEQFLNKVTKLTINYHNALLPKYAGMHATSWAILNDESQHGITWHVVTDKLDAGAILKQAQFPIDKKDTALTLNLKCYEHAIQTFDKLVNDLEDDTLKFIEQDSSQRSYYPLSKRPPQNGIMTWHQTAHELEKMFRALTLGNCSNLLGVPKFLVENDVYCIQELEVLSVFSTEAPGEIVSMTGETQLQIATLTYNIAIKKITNLEGITFSINELAEKYKLKAGYQLPNLKQSVLNEIEEIATQNVKYEDYWAQAFSQIIPGKAPLSLRSMQGQGQTPTQISAIQIPEFIYLKLSLLYGDTLQRKDILLAALIIYLFRLNNCNSFSVRLIFPELYDLYEKYEQFFSHQLPLTIHISPEHEFHAVLQWTIQEINFLKTKGVYARDLNLRCPEIGHSMDSIISIELTRDLDKHQAKSALSLVLAEDGSGLGVFAEIDNVDFSRFSMLFQNMPLHILTLLNDVTENSDKAINRLDFLSLPEQEQLLVDWNNTQTAYFEHKTIQDFFEEQVIKTPHRIAVVSDDHTITYEELNNRVNQLANYLRKHGVTKESLVPICANRDITMVLGILAIIKAGGAYLPLDHSYPPERLQFMLDDCKAPILLVNHASLKQIFSEFTGKIVDLTLIDKELQHESMLDPENYSTADSLAYVIYTSGSTGKPKGVCITHRSLINHMSWMLNKFQFTKKDIFLQKTPFSFDASVWEFFAPLLCGGRLVMAPDDAHTDTTQLIALVIKYKITILQLVPSILKAMFAQSKIKNCTSLKQVFCGGEALPSETIQLFFKKTSAKLHNLYGPTEATIETVTCSYQSAEDITGATLIGKPIDNTQIYVLDNNLQLMPAGAIGELHISGDALAKGYLNQDQLTRTKFIQNPFNPKENNRLYKTGDLARWLPNGNLEYMGRMDDQIKVNGQRLELGEIESCISECELISQCTVMVNKPSTDKNALASLVAFLVLKQETEFVETKLRSFLNKMLPYYMIPKQFIILNSLPLLPNGKLDRKNLPKIEPYSWLGSRREYVLPTNFEEEILASIWKSVLEIRDIGIHDNLFDLGSTSLSMFRMIRLIQDHFSVKLNIRDLFEFPTIALLAKAIRTERRTRTVSPKSSHTNAIPFPIITLQANGFKSPLFFFHPVGGTISWYKTLSRHLGTNRPIYAIQDPGIDTQAFLFNSIEEMAAFYLQSIKKIQPKGPYFLAGASFGATIAIEIAKQFKALGEKINYIGLLDGWAVYPDELDNRDFFEKYMSEQNKYSGITDTEFLLKLQWHRKSLLREYKLSNIEHPLTLFKANEIWPTFESIDSPLNGWEKFTSETIELYNVPGSHTTIMWEPRVQILGKLILKSLTKISALEEKKITNTVTKIGCVRAQ